MHRKRVVNGFMHDESRMRRNTLQELTKCPSEENKVDLDLYCRKYSRIIHDQDLFILTKERNQMKYERFATAKLHIASPDAITSSSSVHLNH